MISERGGNMIFNVIYKPLKFSIKNKSSVAERRGMNHIDVKYRQVICFKLYLLAELFAHHFEARGGWNLDDWTKTL